MALVNPSFVGQIAALVAAGVGANSPDQENVTGKGINLYINITNLAGTTPSLTVTLQGKDSLTNQYYTILASVALNATGFTRLVVYPGIVAAANTAANDILPDTWRIVTAVGGSAGQAVTATISACIIP